MLKSEYLQRVYSQVVTRDPDQREFHQAVLEVLESLDLIVDKHPGYHRSLCGAGAHDFLPGALDG